MSICMGDNKSNYLLQIYAGPAVVTSKDAGDAITLLQSLTASTFDSSQLVLTACMGFLTITEDRLQGLREKHRPSVVAAIEERAKGGRVSKDPKGLANKLYSFKHAPESLVKESMMEAGSDNKLMSGKVSDTESHSTNMDEFLNSRTINTEVDSLPDLKDQVGYHSFYLEFPFHAPLITEETYVLFVETTLLAAS